MRSANLGCKFESFSHIRFIFITFFACRVSLYGRCNVWPSLIEFSDVLLSCFTFSSLDYIHWSITHKSGRLAHTPVARNCLFVQRHGSGKQRIRPLNSYLNDEYGTASFVCLCTRGRPSTIAHHLLSLINNCIDPPPPLLLTDKCHIYHEQSLHAQLHVVGMLRFMSDIH